MAKTIQVSDDAGVNWYTLPGSTGDFNRDGSALDDTVFGQDFGSNQPGIISWTMSANGYYKGFAGYVATIKKQGTSTIMTGETATNTSGNSYQIDAAAKQIWDRSASFTFYDNLVAIPASEIESVDYLFGIVTFNVAQTGPITIDGNYFPTADFGKAQSFSLTQSADTTETTDLSTAQANNGFATFSPTLLTATLEMSGFYDSANGFNAALTARDEYIIELNPDGNGYSLARGFFKLSADNQSGDVGGDETESVTFNLFVPAGDSAIPFGWYHDSVNTTLSQSVQVCLSAWAGKTEIDARYLPNGTTGYSGKIVVTDASLAGGVDAMNEFSFSFQGSGAISTV